MAEQKWEHWWAVKCKSPGCRGNILMSKIANVEDFKDVLGAIPPGESLTDWEESCPYCGAHHKYGKGDVFSAKVDINKAGPGSGSRAFRRAWSNAAA